MSLLPPNAGTLEKGLEAATCVPALPVPLRDGWNPQTCPASLLPWLAWALSIDNWNAAWPIAVRRSVVAKAIEVQRRKGTIGAVNKAIASYGAAMSLREWWELSPQGDAGTFEVSLAIADVEGEPPGSEFIDAVVAEIERTKPLSRHFTFSQALEIDGAVGVIAAARPAIYARLACTA